MAKAVLGLILGKVDSRHFEVLLSGTSIRATALRLVEQPITIAAAEALVVAGCTVTVVEGEKVFLEDSLEPIAIDPALRASGEPCFQVKRVIEGTLQDGWVDFVGAEGIEVTADENLKLHSAL